MRAENHTTGHNRTIRLAEIPPRTDGGHLEDLVITISYVDDGPAERNRLYKAITLNNCVIPAILAAVNAAHMSAQLADDDRETIEPGDARYYRPTGVADR